VVTDLCCLQIYNDKTRVPNLYTNNTQVDYRNEEVTLDSILRVLTDRHPPGTARSRRLLSDKNSNVLVYITGHGGDEFMKIQVISVRAVCFFLCN
jgi:GPI-anchor transamidase subunit K